MKIPALVTVLALACGAAFASGTSSTDRHATAAAATSGTHEGPIAKTKRALHRLGDRMRHMGDTARAPHRDDSEYAMNRNDPRSMGAAAGSETPDSARQRRMDEAYAHWKDQQKH